MLLATEEKVLVTYPESQDLIDYVGFEDNSWLINGSLGVELFGENAYVVEIKWYNSKKEKYTYIEEEDNEGLEPDLCDDDFLLAYNFITKKEYNDYYCL